MTRLRRSRFDVVCIQRRRSGHGFQYRWSTGERLTDRVEIARIQNLAIPPAWSDVWICPWPHGHIQAVGFDGAGRRQYRYHNEWRRQRDLEKFSRMVEFGLSLPALRSQVERDISLPSFPRQRVLALGVRLLDIGMFRVGGEEYAEAHDTYGLATLEKRHVKLTGDTATFDYSAKGGKERLLTLSDPEVVELIDALKRRRGGGDDLLAWRDGRRWKDVRSVDINDYIKEVSGGPFTAKDFRTWSASLLAAVLLATEPPVVSQNVRTRQIARVVRQVAEALGNTPAVCRASYIDPRIFDHYEHGESVRSTIADLGNRIDQLSPAALCGIERAVIELLDDTSPLLSGAEAGRR
jgi:DNA topoisomerase I